MTWRVIIKCRWHHSNDLSGFPFAAFTKPMRARERCAGRMYWLEALSKVVLPMSPPSLKLSYDIVPHNGGWAIVVTPDRTHAFASKIDAYAASVEFARKLRAAGYAVHVHVHHEMKHWRDAQAS